MKHTNKGVVMLKRLILTKTFWLGIGGVISGAALIAKGSVTEGVLVIGGAIQSIFIRDAISKSK